MLELPQPGTLGCSNEYAHCIFFFFFLFLLFLRNKKYSLILEYASYLHCISIMELAWVFFAYLHVVFSFFHNTSLYILSVFTVIVMTYSQYGALITHL